MGSCCIIDKRFKEHGDGTISMDPLCRATLRQVNVPYGEYLDFTLGKLSPEKTVVFSGAWAAWAPGWDFVAHQPNSFDEWLVAATLKTGLVPDFERVTLVTSASAFQSGYRTLIEKDLRTGKITYEIPEFENYFSRIDEADRQYAKLK